MKKNYNTPRIATRQLKAARFFAASVLDPNSGNPSVTPGNDPYDDEFSAPKPNLWDEEDGGNNKQ
ncbi:MAG: hypothetical protein J6I60_05865 [Bacteroidaceae bacterium]|nr:hypothetical protein [Bacteroidaceae bacterium]